MATRLGRRFVDTDLEIEREAGRTIAEIFEAKGETYFRELEARVIEAAGSEGAVVALGGGSVTAPGVLARLLETGQLVFLRAAPEVLVDRIGDPASRPLLAGLDRAGRVEKLRQLLSERMPLYQRAQIEIDASGTTESVVERLLDALASK